MGLLSKSPTQSTRVSKAVYIKGRAVGDSRDLRRVLALPKRERPDEATLLQWAKDLKAEFGTGVTACECRSKYNRMCCAELLPVQAWLLHEARLVRGMLGPVGVGHGKTLCDLLVAMVVGSKKAALFLPSNLKSQLLDVDWHFYGQHWKLPNLAGGYGKWLVPGRPSLYVLSYSELSGAKATDLLQKLRPDTFILDEAHALRNFTAARTKRFKRYFTENPDTALFAWSGTLTSKSLKDYAHLSNFALKDSSPTPHHWPTTEEWAGHLDPSEFRNPPGKLLSFCLEGSDDASHGFSQRLVSTKGVVSSGDSNSCQASLVFSERKIVAPEPVKKLIEELKKTWQRPDGEELIDAMSAQRCARQLSCGFYYRWRWPRKEPTEVILRWLEARKNWHKELREKLKHAQLHMDSPKLLEAAAKRWYEGYTHDEENENGIVQRRVQIEPKSKNGPSPTWAAEYYQEWLKVRDSAVPETEAVWVDSFFTKDCYEWLKEGPGVLWYEFNAVAQSLVRLCAEYKLPIRYACPGPGGDEIVTHLKGSESVVASIRAHGTGKHFHMFSRNNVANPPSSGDAWEQLLGRTFRPNQQADEVSVDVYRHTESMINAVEKARDLSDYIQGTFQGKQLLASKATWLF